MIFKPHDYQRFMLDWLVKRTIINDEPGAALFADPGLGKTVTTLTWMNHLQLLGRHKFLVIAPLRVMTTTWPEEIEQWDHANFTYSIMHGTPTERAAALAQDVDIYLINPAGVPWLESHGLPDGFNLVVDESTAFKRWGSKKKGVRYSALRKMLPKFNKRLILTGTPAANSLMDLFAQVYLLDHGKALGSNVTAFRNEYCRRGGYQGREWLLKEDAADRIWERIAPMCLRMDADTYLDLPDLLVNDVKVSLPDEPMKFYRKMERELFAELEKQEATALSAGAAYQKCKQIANGVVYGDDGEIIVHNEKLEAAKDIIDELNGKPAMLVFHHKSMLAAIHKKFGEVPFIDGSTKPATANQLVTDWNAGKLHLLAVQPQSLSHGVNMQKGPGRDIIWLGVVDSPEIYHQLNARVYRQGVSSAVRVHRILARGTTDITMVRRMQEKDGTQESFFQALKSYQRGVHRETVREPNASDMVFS